MSHAFLPETWQWTTLGDVSKLVQYGINASAGDDSNGYVFLRITDITEHGEISNGNRKHVYISNDNLEKYQLYAGDLLIARSGTVGRSFVVTEKEEGWVFASYLIRFRLDLTMVLPAFLGFLLRSSIFSDYVERTSHTVSVSNINSQELKSFKFLLPPLEEQQYILEILQEADKLHRLRKDSLKKVEELASALFLEMFGDPVINPNGWNIKKLSDIVDTLEGGKSILESSVETNLKILKVSAVTYA